MLLDEFCPCWDFAERHERKIGLPASRVFENVQAVRFQDMPLVSQLLALRSFDYRAVLGRHVPSVVSAEGSVLQVMERNGFFRLAEEPQVELVLGVIGAFWKLRGDRPVRLRTPQEFLDFRERGYAKLVLNFHVTRVGEGSCLLSTQTRIIATDTDARRRFAVYWFIIRPWSGLIRRLWLKAIADHRQGQRSAQHD